ncbi:MAG: DUF433 domain-containing protein [Chloroflexi bacterium]|nr:DUF433 domain-containing protein [Chloroflexota bacterium]
MKKTPVLHVRPRKDISLAALTHHERDVLKDCLRFRREHLVEQREGGAPEYFSRAVEPIDSIFAKLFIVENPFEPWNPEPFPIEKIVGARLPVVLRVEPREGDKLSRKIQPTYEYYPIGEHVVAAPGVCGGTATFYGTRICLRHALNLLIAGWSMERVLISLPSIPLEWLNEAITFFNTNSPEVFEVPLLPEAEIAKQT